MDVYLDIQLKVDETKGLLKGLEDRVHRTRFNLAIDNIDKVQDDLDEIKRYISAIETKIKTK